MNTAARMTVMGLGLITGATLAVGPAQAALPTGQAATSSSANQQQNPRYDDEVVGYYRNFWNCERAGRFGERQGAWYDYDCYRVRWGYHRGAWALVVGDRYWDNGWDDRWRPGHWPGGWSNRPYWAGGGHWNGSDGGGQWNGGGGGGHRNGGNENGGYK